LAFDPISSRLDRLPSSKAREVYERVFRPERVTLSVAGKFTPGAVAAAWKSRMAAWQPPRFALAREDYSMSTVYTRNLSGVTTIDIASPLVPKSADLYPRLLALFALGSGKGGSLFEVVRQQLGLSYRQEGILSPTRDGLETRLLIAASPVENEDERIAKIKAELLKDIETWTETDRKRAIGMASAASIEGTERGPFYFSGNTPIASDLSGRALLGAYWQMKVGVDWDGALLLANLRDVPLTELKEAAKTIVNGQVRLLRG
jgi:predicted Zn-dependent peptidase